MKVAVSDYKAKLVISKKKYEAAFDKAAEAYRQKKDLENAKAVLLAKAEFVTSDADSRAEDRRTKWDYNDGKYWFKAGKGGEWVELANDDGAVNKYREAERNQDFVELYKVIEKTTRVRLYAGHSEVKYLREPWKLLYKGKWSGDK